MTMANYEESLKILSELYGKDSYFVLATAKDNIPSQRVVDIYYEDGAFWIVTYASSKKVKELDENPNVSFCNNFTNFKAKAYNVGHPLKEENKEIRETLTKVFAPWYFAHNNEKDEHMCFVKAELTSGFFHTKGKGYHINFEEKSVKEIDFAPEED